MKKNICDHELCSGCGACQNACKLNCLKLVSDDNGFLYPFVDETICVECGACFRACPVNNVNHSVRNDIKGYGAIALDDNIRKNSSSGGIFSLLAMEVLKEGGSVFGISMDDECRHANYIKINNINDLYKIQGSKYIQSDVKLVYRSVLTELENANIVLFSGVSCQIEALKSFLKKDYENLICVDMICHGVPSPLLWNKYLDYIEKKRGKIKSVNFRCKKYSWSDFGISLKNRQMFLFESKDYNPYMQLFLSDIALRESCYNCQFKGFSRASDITLGDFWGCNEYAPELCDEKGTSIVLINSSKGEKIFKKVNSKVRISEIDYKDVFENHNDAMVCSATMPDNRNQFFDDLKSKEFQKIIDLYVHISKKEKFKMLLDKIGLLQLYKKYFHRGGAEINTNSIGNYGILIVFK